VHPEARPRIRPTSPPPPYAPRTLNHGTTHESGVQSPHRVEHPNDQNGVIRPHQGPYRHATSSSGRNTTKREGHTSKNVRQIRSDARGSETRTTSEHTERGGRGSNTAKKTNSAAGGSTAGSTQRPRSRGSHVPDIFSKPQSVAEGSVAQSTKDEEDVAESLANLPKWGGSNQYQGPGS